MSTAAFQTFERFSRSLGRKFEPEVRYHLMRVYLCLSATTAAAAAGSVLFLTGILDTGILGALASFVLVLSLHFIRDNGKNFYTRMAMLLGFGFCSGQALGPLLEYVVHLNPAIIVTALSGTVITFLTLSLAALLAEQGKYIFLGGLLVSVLNTMALMSILNIFMRSYIVTQFHLYVGLAAMAGFVLFDTQMIIEKCRMGNKDCIQHSLDLFFDLISMFRKLLIILTQKEEKQRQNKRRD